MGQSKSRNRRALEVTRIQYICNSIMIKLQEYKRSREAILTLKEKELLKIIQEDNQRNKQSEIHQISSIIEDFLSINAAETIIRKTDVLKDCALTVNQSQGRLQPIKDLSPFIENICLSNIIFKLECINNFQQEMVSYFGEDLEMSIQNSKNIDERVRIAISPSVIASQEEMNGYVKQFCFKYNMSLEQFNGSIHHFTNFCNSNLQFGFNNSNQNIYSPSSSKSFSISHYYNGIQPSSHNDNQSSPSRCIPINNTKPQKNQRKNKYLFCG